MACQFTNLIKTDSLTNILYDFILISVGNICAVKPDVFSGSLPTTAMPIIITDPIYLFYPYVLPRLSVRFYP